VPEALELFQGVGVALELSTLLPLVLGILFGLVVGVLPGMGPLLGVVLAIPFTFHLPPVPSIALLIGIYQGGYFGGAITATVLGIPGTPMAAATLLDAYPMALRGQASEAVTLTAVASFVGTLLSGLALLFLAPALAEFALGFGPSETFALALLGLCASVTLSQGAMLKGMLAALFGLALATMGTDPITGLRRFNLGFTELEGGIGLVPMFMGLFAVSELLVQLEKPVRAWQAVGRIRPVLSVFRTLGTRLGDYLRSSVIGIAVGIVPATGGVPASFMAYATAKSLSRRPQGFGKGEARGVIASEAANSATVGGALIPTLALGIPGDPVAAAMMAGLLIQGLTPGPMLFFTHVQVLDGIFAAFILGSLLLLPISLASIPIFVRVLRVPHAALQAAIALLCVLGVFLVQRYVVDLWQLAAFGLIGYLFRKTGVPLAPPTIGFVLGPFIEDNLRRTTIVMGEDVLGFLAGRPITLVIFALVALVLAAPVIRAGIRRVTRGRAVTDPPVDDERPG